MITVTADRSLRNFVATLVGAMLFVYYTSESLPELVASHFNRTGEATGFVPRAIYIQITLGIVLLPPMFLALVPRLSLRNPKARLNLPNSDYWLAPERREQTVAIIAQQCTHFAVMLLVFLCYVHWLIVRANASVPQKVRTFMCWESRSVRTTNAWPCRTVSA